tara:strand:- start:1026 stop:1211 length:186 start_codon:yes stop_codon:yes gene_type:complete
MTIQNITMSSTKADIIEASEELIGDLEGRLSTATKIQRNMQEERNAVTYLLIVVSIFSILF